MRRHLLNLLTILTLLLFVTLWAIGEASKSGPVLFRFLDCELIISHSDVLFWSNAQHAWITRSLTLRPFLLLTLALPAFRVAAFFDHWRSRCRYGHCPGCGRDLHATPNRCPECGTEAGAAASRRASRPLHL